MISEFGNLPLYLEDSVQDLKEGGEGICTKDLSSFFLAGQVVLLSGLTCNSMQCVDVYSEKDFLSTPKIQQCSVHLLRESECKDAVKMSRLSGTRVLPRTSGVRG